MKRPWQPPADVKLETDPRFPSGPWIGFWLQRAYIGRQWMSLNLSFADGRVQGEGTDRIGDFVMSGAYELKTGICRINKSYVGGHDVLYEGRNEDDGMWIWGLWQIRAFDRGGFHMWPEGEEDPTGKKLKGEEKMPVPEKPKVVLEPVET